MFKKIDLIQNKNLYFLVICLLGSIVRILYGYMFEPWNEASDQLALEILIKEGTFTYDQLIHYPHEGGTIFISLLGKVIQFFTDFNSLTVVAVILDFLIRFGQVTITSKLFGNRIAILFGIWTICAFPAIIPWGTVNFGLHYLSSIFPFICMLLLFQKRTDKRYNIVCGFFLGIAFWFSYSNLVLVIFYFFIKLLFKDKRRYWYYAVPSFILVLVVHLFVRINTDPGFHLSGSDLSQIRGVQFFMSDIDVIHLVPNMFQSLMDASTATFIDNTFVFKGRGVALVFIVLGIIGAFKLYGKHKREMLAMWLFLMMFLVVYCLSPFFNDAEQAGNYVVYRHLSYVLPLVSLLLILGMDQLRFKQALLGVFLTLNCFNALLLFTNKYQPPKEINEKSVGWVLGAKLGHNPERLSKIIANDRDDNKLLFQGIGWGMSTALCDLAPNQLMAYKEERVEQLIQLFHKFPAEFRPDVYDGIEFSFSSQVKPRLNKELFTMFKNEIQLGITLNEND